MTQSTAPKRREAAQAPTSKDAPPTKPEVIFVCSYCGASRTSKTLSRGLPLKCAACGLTTDHTLAGVREGADVVAWDRHRDWREKANTEEQAKIRTLLWLEGVYMQFGVEVRTATGRIESKKGEVLYETSHEVRDHQHVWCINISPDATIQGRINALRRGLADFVGTAVDYEHTSRLSCWFHYPSRGDLPEGQDQ